MRCGCGWGWRCRWWWGAATGHLEYGAWASLGALPAGFASFQGATRTRVAAVAVASLGMAMSTFVGGLAAAHAPWLLAPIVALLGYLTGLSVCLGPRWSTAVVQWPVALLIAVGVPLGPSPAGLRALLVLAGGLLQGLLVAVEWLLRRDGAERSGLADSFRTLARYAVGVAAGKRTAPPPSAFAVTDVLADPNPLLRGNDLLDYADLLEQAERMRGTLAALAEGPTSASRSFVAGTARTLDAVADVLDSRRADRAALLHELDGRLADLDALSPEGGPWAAQALLGQLRAAAAVLARHDAAPRSRRGSRARLRLPVGARAHHRGQWTFPALRANLSLAGETGRHALRLAVVAGITEALVQGTRMYEGRWAVLTVFLVLKPDFTATLQRGVRRALGTAVGAGAAALVALADPGPDGLTAAAVLAIAVAYALFDANYLLYTVFLTLYIYTLYIYIVILLDTLGVPADSTAAARLAQTALGSAIALLGYWLWPTWAGRTVHETFARLLTVHSRYVAALLDQAGHPDRLDPAGLRALQAQARRARGDAEASAARLADEPARLPECPSLSADSARTLVAAVNRLAQAELALHSLVLQQAQLGEGEPGPGAEPLARRLDAVCDGLTTALDKLAKALRTGKPTVGLPSLRPLEAALGGEPPVLDSRYVAVTDSLVDAVEVLAAAVERLASS